MLLKMGIKVQQQTNIYKHFVIIQQINNTCLVQGSYAKFKFQSHISFIMIMW